MIPAAARLFNTVFNTCSHFEYPGECLTYLHDNKCPGWEENYDSHDMHSE